MDYFSVLSIVFYVVAAVLASKQLFTKSKTLLISFLASASIALIAHATWLYQHIFLLSGQNLPILNVALLVAFIICLLSTLASKKINTGILLPLVYGFTVVNFITAVHLPSHYITHLEIHPHIGTHIIFALLAYSVLTIASLFAVQLAYLDYRLKHRKAPLTGINMPPLMTLEKSLFQFIFIGFVLLTCTLFTGFVFLEDMFVHGKAHKAVLTIIGWCIYAVLLWGHHTKGWRGRMIVYITIVGSSLLTLAYFGSRFVREVILT